ncbi:hypothetical protein ACTQ5K_23145, partial [Niallia sp. Sow4_A1]
FRLDCGFLVSDSIPSEAAYSRMITILCESDVLENVQAVMFTVTPRNLSNMDRECIYMNLLN